MASHITIGLRLRSGLQAIRATMTKSSFLPVFLSTDGDKKTAFVSLGRNHQLMEKSTPDHNKGLHGLW